jgi:toxin ParE1/3/4
VAERPRRGLHITGPARRDIASIIRWSLQDFGGDAALRYEALILQAFRDLQADPERTGAKQRPELAENVFAYHLRHSRDRARLGFRTVRTPRHFILYRRQGQAIEILRLLHDARDLERHLSEEHRAGPEEAK